MWGKRDSRVDWDTEIEIKLNKILGVLVLGFDNQLISLKQKTNNFFVYN